MTLTPGFELIARREVLVSHGRPVCGPRWLRDLGDELRPVGVVLTHTHSGPDTICRIEHGGLSGAILVGDQRGIDGLSILRIIRSIDVDLPCWLVAERTTPRTLQTALSLGARSVITYPVEVRELTLALSKVLMDPNPEN